MSQLLTNKDKLQEALNILQNKATPSGVNTSDATASAEDVFNGKTAYIASGKVTGKMPSNDATSTVLDVDNTSYVIQKGYHTGNGEVSINLENKSVTPTKSEQTVTPSDNKVLSKVTVAAIPANYITTTDATATANDVLNGKTAYVDGEKIVGTITTNTANNVTVSGADVTIPAGYYATNITKSVEETTQATPTITVDAAGLITADAVQTEGYVQAGTVSTTKQLAFQPAKTITPGTTDQIAVLSGHYTGGDITVTGDSNLVAGNIKSGVSIFGVNGNYAGNSNIDEFESAILTRSIESYTNYQLTVVGEYAFAGCSKLTSVDLPLCTSIGNYAFTYCKLTSVDFPECIRIGSNAFNNCTNLTSVNFPMCTSIGNFAFSYCSKLTSVDLPLCTSIGTSVFGRCTSLASVNFPSCTTIGNYAFTSCSNLTTANFPVCTSIGSSAFIDCTSLASVNFPECISINWSAFYRCSNLTTANFPVCTTISNNAFMYCYSLSSVSFPACTSIGVGAFAQCYNLTSLTLCASTVCKLSNSNAFASTPIVGYTSSTGGVYGSIYVPASLVDAYKKATNWTYFSSRITAIQSKII